MTVGNVAAPGGRKKEAPLLCCLLPKSSLRWSLKHSYKNYYTHKPYLAFFFIFFFKISAFYVFFYNAINFNTNLSLPCFHKICVWTWTGMHASASPIEVAASECCYNIIIIIIYSCILGGKKVCFMKAS